MKKRFWFLAAILVLVLWFGIGLVGVYVNALSLRQSFSRLRQHYSQNDIFKLSREILVFKDELGDLDFWTKWIRPVEILPGTGADLKALRALAQISFNMTSQIEPHIIFGEPPFGAQTKWSARGLTKEEFEALRKIFPDPKDFHKIVISFENGSLRLKRLIRERSYPRAGRTLVRLDQKLDDIILRLKFWDNAWFLLQNIFVNGSEKNILLLLVNEHEARPGGGIVTAYGVLNVKYGEVDLIEFNDSYNLRGNLREVLKNDFKTGAENALEILKLNQRVDLVMAVNSEFFVELARHLNGFAEKDSRFAGFKVDADTLVEELEKEVHFKYVDRGLKPKEKKEILKSLGLNFLTKGQALGMKEWFSLGDFAQSELRQKNLLVSSSRPELSPDISRNMWDGSAPRVAVDQLKIEDNNIGGNFNKTDRVVMKSYNYSVIEGKNKWKAKLVLEYKHLGLKLTKVGEYKDEIRVKVPGKIVSVPKFSLKPNQKKRIVLEYEFPKTRDGVYDLAWIKQPGANDPEVSFSAKFRTPIREIETNAGGVFTYLSSEYKFQGKLLQDYRWNIKFF